MKVKKPGVDINLLIVNTIKNTDGKLNPFVDIILFDCISDESVLIASCKDVLHAITIRDSIAKEILSNNNWVFKYCSDKTGVRDHIVVNPVRGVEND